MANNDNDPIIHLPSSLFFQHRRMKPNGFPILRSVDQECETGWDTNDVVEFQDKCPFVCSICRGFPRYPIELRECGHIFCYFCIAKVKRSTNETGIRLPKKCPNCRVYFTKYDIINFEMASAALRSIYSTYEIRCPYQCGYVSSPKAILKHETMDCKYRPVLCTSHGCHTVLPDEQMQQHLAECTKRFVHCNKCRLPMVVNNVNHKCIDANRESVKCVFPSNFVT